MSRLLISILLIAFLLRFYQLSSLPPALDWDEASTAYNAYSLLKTGADEYGKHFPFLFRAYNGYVPPVLVYLNALSVGIFGLTEFAARVPNALLGSWTVLGFYLLILELSKRKNLAVIGALLLAISPWHIVYSRVNFFATLPDFFIVFATYFLIKNFKSYKLLLLSSLFFALAVLSYFSAYVFVPIFSAALALIYRKKLGFKNLITVIAPNTLLAIFILFFAGGGQSRLNGVSAFSDPDIIKQSSRLTSQDGFAGNIIDNRRIVYGQKFLEGYFASFRFDFLFGKADQVTRMIVPGSGFGLLYWWDLPFILAGVYFLLNKKPNGWKVILLWLALSPAAAAPTLPQMTSTRTTLMIPALVALSAYGFYFSTRDKNSLIKGFLIALLAFNFLIFANGYFRHFSRENSDKWFYGYRDLFLFLNSERNSNKNVYFVFKQPDILDQVYMFNLFYNKVDPVLWQNNGGTKLGCMATTGQITFERYVYIPYACLDNPVGWEITGNDDLVVVSKNLGVNSVGEIKFLDGKAAFFVYSYGDVKEKLPEKMGPREL